MLEIYIHKAPPTCSMKTSIWSSSSISRVAGVSVSLMTVPIKRKRHYL